MTDHVTRYAVSCVVRSKKKQVLLEKIIKHSEAATRGVLCKKVFLEISQNSQENTCARVSFLIKLQTLPKRVQLDLEFETMPSFKIFRKLS